MRRWYKCKYEKSRRGGEESILKESLGGWRCLIVKSAQDIRFCRFVQDRCCRTARVSGAANFLGQRWPQDLSLGTKCCHKDIQASFLDQFIYKVMFSSGRSHGEGPWCSENISDFQSCQVFFSSPPEGGERGTSTICFFRLWIATCESLKFWSFMSSAALRRYETWVRIRQPFRTLFFLLNFS